MNAKLRKVTLALVALVAAIYLGLCALLFFVQRSLIYFPQPASRAVGADTMELHTDGARVLVSTRRLPSKNAVIYFGGNAEDVAYSLPLLAEAFPGQALYLMNYRGYGGSSGTPSEAALVADALVLFDQVAAEHTNITVIGRSLGSGVAVHLASLRPAVARLVLVTPYNSLQELAAKQFPYVPVRWILQDKFESGRHAEKVSAPTLLIAAEHDEVIPTRSTAALFGHFRKGIATLAVVPGAGHNDISNDAAYLRLLRGRQQ